MVCFPCCPGLRVWDEVELSFPWLGDQVLPGDGTQSSENLVRTWGHCHHSTGWVEAFVVTGRTWEPPISLLGNWIHPSCPGTGIPRDPSSRRPCLLSSHLNPDIAAINIPVTPGWPVGTGNNSCWPSWYGLRSTGKEAGTSLSPRALELGRGGGNAPWEPSPRTWNSNLPAPAHKQSSGRAVRSRESCVVWQVPPAWLAEGWARRVPGCSAPPLAPSPAILGSPSSSYGRVELPSASITFYLPFLPGSGLNARISCISDVY